MDIRRHPEFIRCGGELVCQMVGGSHLYGLNNEDSDVDYRGIFRPTNKVYRAGLKKIQSIVMTEDKNGCDAVYYSLSHFLYLLEKTNTQVMEQLFAPSDAFTHITPTMEFMRENRLKLIDSERLKSSLLGYVKSELRLATGERSGQLGGKRKNAVQKYGFSPKNFCQIFRLIYVGKEFFKNEVYPVNIGTYDPNFQLHLMDIKNNPERYTKEQLVEMVAQAEEELKVAMNNSDVNLTFDWNLAAQIILEK